MNHTSKACLSQRHLSHYYASFTKYNFWKSFLFFFWIHITHVPASSLAIMPNSRGDEELQLELKMLLQQTKPQDSSHSTGLPTAFSLCECIAPATSSTKSRQPKAGATLQWTRPLTPRWKISENQIHISSPVRAAAKKDSSALDLERLCPLIPWRKSKSRKRDQHCTGILADGYKTFWQVVCLALIGKYL